MSAGHWAFWVAIAALIAASGKFLDDYHIKASTKSKMRDALIKSFVWLDAHEVPDLGGLILRALQALFRWSGRFTIYTRPSHTRSSNPHRLRPAKTVPLPARGFLLGRLSNAGPTPRHRIAKGRRSTPFTRTDPQATRGTIVVVPQTRSEKSIAPYKSLK
jgi:hypothetical protein